MNISDRNAIVGDSAAKNQNVADRARAEKADKTAQETAKSQAENQPVEVSREQVSTDKYLTSDERQKAREIAGAIKTEEPPREEVVKRAQDRMLSGYYNSEEVMGRMALMLVNTQKA